jgi:hypothetical protein
VQPEDRNVYVRSASTQIVSIVIWWGALRYEIEAVRISRTNVMTV